MNRSETPAPGVSPAGQQSSLDLNKLVDQFVRLRDRKRALEQQHKDQLKPFNKLLDEIGNSLLSYMNQTGVNSLSTPGGTAHQVTKKSAVIRDGAAFRKFIVSTDHFDLVDWRANAVAVFAFIKEHEGEVPPGVHASTFTSINVRRPNEEE